MGGGALATGVVTGAGVFIRMMDCLGRTLGPPDGEPTTLRFCGLSGEVELPDAEDDKDDDEPPAAAVGVVVAFEMDAEALPDCGVVEVLGGEDGEKSQELSTTRASARRKYRRDSRFFIRSSGLF